MAPDAPKRFTPLQPLPSAATALATLPETVARWFRQRFAVPTSAQRLAWPTLAAGNNLLLSAPTGSGKTLAAFVPILADLLQQQESAALGPRCLYVAPLKALVQDVRKTLKRVRHELRAFLLTERALPGIGQRTGDTPVRIRRLLMCRPPDILLTTPESLALLLSQPAAETFFAALRWLVVDEVHALASSKRGADLALSLERLETLASAPLRRVGLSATCSPLTAAAGFLVGAQRCCTLATVTEQQPLQLTIEPLEPVGSGFLRSLLDRLEPELRVNRTTLIFTNVRSLAERLTWALRRRHPDWVEQIGVHHSSISRGRRRDVERRLQAGQLRVVVSSTSLELGIDISQVDGVILVHPPGSVVRLLQRIGRSGHAPHGRRRGLVLTATPAELLEAAVTGACAQSAQLEPLTIPEHPLDVLCQQLLGMAAQRWWTATEAWEVVRRAWPYRRLSRQDFDDCLNYLSGRDHLGRAWLPARLCWDGDAFSILDERTARILQRNIGTILAEEHRPVCLPRDDAARSEPRPAASPRATIGHVDESYADRLQPGDRFLLDGRCLEFRRIANRALVVEEVPGRPAPPRWSSSGWSLSADLARRLYLLRMRAAEALREGPAVLTRLLRQEYGLADKAAATLVKLFQRQECVSEIPDERTCLVEVVPDGLLVEHYVHTPLNRAGNDALARLVVWRLLQQGRSATSLVADLGLMISVRGRALTADELRCLLAAPRFDDDLAAAVAESWSLRECFRQTALIGLMLLRRPLGRRRRVGGRDWAERRLFEQAQAADADFVLLRQARREVYASVLDATAARQFTEALSRLALRWRWLPEVSPLAENWTQPAAGAAAAESPAEVLERLHRELMARGSL